MASYYYAGQVRRIINSSVLMKREKKFFLTKYSPPVQFFLIFLGLGLIVLFLIALYQGFILAREKLGLPGKKSYVGGSFEKSLAEMEPEAKKHFNRSLELFEQMKANADNEEKVIALNEKNISELEKALNTDPNNPRIWLNLGSAYTWPSEDGSYEDGLAAYQKAEMLDPANIVYINNVGDMLIRLERYEEAVKQLRKTFTLTRKSAFANLSIGIAYKELGETELARDHLKEAVKLFEKENSSGLYDERIERAKEVLGELD